MRDERAEAAIEVLDGASGSVEDIPAVEAALQTLREVTQEMTDRDVQWAMYVRVLGICLRSRFELHGDPEDLEDALRLVQDALDNSPEQYVMLWCDVTESVWMRAQYFGDRDDLDKAVELAEWLLPELSDDDDPLGIQTRSNYAAMMHARYTVDGDPADLDEAITVRRRLLSSSPLDEDERPPVLVAHGNSLHLRFERQQRAADLDEAIAVLSEAMAGDHPLRPTAAFELSGSLLQRFLRTREPGDIDAAVDVARQETDSGPDMLTALSRALGMRFDILHDPDDLDEAIDVGRAALAETPEDHPDTGQYCGNLSILLGLRGARTKDQVDLDEAVEWGAKAVELTDEDDPARGLVWYRFGIALRMRGTPEDLDGAVEASRVAAGVDSPMRAQYLHGLSLALNARFAVSGDVADVTEAIAAVTTAIDLDPPTDLSQLHALLGDLYFRRYQVVQDPDDLDLLIGHARLVRAPWAELPDFMYQYGNVLWTRYQLSARAEDRDEAIVLCRQSVEADPDNLRNLGALVVMLNGRYEATGHAEDLDEAVDVGRDALSVAPNDEGALAILAGALWARFYRSGERSDVDETIALGERLVAMAPAEDNLERYQSMLGQAYRARFEQLHDQDDRAAAEKWERLTGVERDLWADAIGPEHGDAWAAKRGLQAIGYLHMAMESDDPSALDRAIVLVEEAAGLFSPGQPGALEAMANLITALWARFTRQGHLADLDRAIEVGRTAVAAGGGSNVQASLGGALHARYVRFGRLPDLNDAITAIRAAIDGFENEDPADDEDGDEDDRRDGLLMMLSNLSLTLRARFERTGDLTDLTEAIDAGRASLELMTEDNSTIPQSNLSATILQRFRRLGDHADLEEAVALGRAAVAAAQPENPDRAGALANLGFALQERSEWSTDGADLDEAIEQIRAAVAASPPGYAELPMYLSGLGTALRQRYSRNSVLTDLDEGVAANRAAVEIIPAGHPERPRYLSNLALQLRHRFEDLGERSDLDEAIALGQRAVDASPEHHPERPKYLMNLATTLLYGESEVDEAVRLARAALDSGPAGQAMYPMTLAAALNFRFTQSGDPADLDEAISLARAGVTAAPAGHFDRSIHQNTLSELLFTRAWATRSLPDVDEAIAGAREVLAAVGESARRAGPRYTLARALRLRSDLTADPSDGDASLAVWRDAADDRLAAPVTRLRAGLTFGAFSAELGRWPDAVDGYATAIEMMPLAAWRGSGRSSREHLLTQYAGLASEAASSAIAAGDPDRAVELLEHGRGVLWSQILETRTDLTALREAAPALAARLSGIRSEIDTPGTVDRQMSLAVRWDAVVREVRALEGFSSFLRPPAVAELRGEGMVVVVNASRHRCDALLVTAEATNVVELPVDAEALTEQAIAYLNALVAVEAGDIVAELDITSTLEWLWDNVTEPILAAIGEPPERLWWCPAGPFSLLPLHAAGYHEEGDRRTVLDRVVSSYTPTLRSLVSARSDRRRPGDNRLLIVAMPDTPGQPPLPNAARERDLLTDLFAAPRHTLTEGPEATRDSVLTHLRTHAWAHFSCHGDQLLDDPSQGGLLLHDDMLTVTELANSRYRGEFAFLSACKTAIGGVQIPDEALTLAAALQYTGWRHVIGTLWSVLDETAADVATEVYTAIARNGELRPERAAQALHAAVLRQRDAATGRPSNWAPFVHIGP
jgi:tetratricopeptide (TPR) repeat protein